MVLFWIGLFIVSLAVLVKASDYFTQAAEKIGIHLGIPAFIVGVTIVSIGTSLPELVTSILAVLDSNSEIVVGNVIGSNITNIFLVLGLAAVIERGMKISYELIRVDLPLLIGSTIMLIITLYDGIFTFYEGLLGLVGVLIYIHYTLKTQEEVNKKKTKKKKNGINVKDLAVLVLSAIFIYFGAEYTLESIIVISAELGIATEIIAASAVALGTSFPELIVSLTAAARGRAEIAVGNVLGSNIFNSFAVMGIPALIAPIVVPESIITFGLPMMVFATLLYYFSTEDKEITMWEGGMLVLFYAVYIGKLFEFV